MLQRDADVRRRLVGEVGDLGDHRDAQRARLGRRLGREIDDGAVGPGAPPLTSRITTSNGGRPELVSGSPVPFSQPAACRSVMT